jgi:transposase
VGKPQKNYSRDEKIEIVKQWTQEGRTVSSLAMEYSVAESAIYRWKAQYEKMPEQAFPGKGHSAIPMDESEQLKRRIQELEQENAFLKKVSAFFAKSQR